MSDKKLNDKNVRRLTHRGRKSIGLTLPLDMVKDLGWREKQRVVVKRVKGGMLIKDYYSKK